MLCVIIRESVSGSLPDIGVIGKVLDCRERPVFQRRSVPLEQLGGTLRQPLGCHCLVDLWIVVEGIGEETPPFIAQLIDGARSTCFEGQPKTCEIAALLDIEGIWTFGGSRYVWGLADARSLPLLASCYATDRDGEDAKCKLTRARPRMQDHELTI